MSTIRPLATIAVLAALGVFLALKINESPSVALQDAWPAETATEAPPAWPAEEPTGESLAARTAPAEAPSPAATGGPSLGGPSLGAPSSGDQSQPPAYPELPELPALDPTAESGAAESGPAFAAEPAPTEQANTTDDDLPLPAEIPQARYGGPSDSTPATPEVSGRVPSLGSTTNDLTPQPPASGPAMSPPAADRYGAAPAEPSPSSAFEEAWPLIEQALARNELTRAHLLLSQWRDTPGLSPARQAEVETLLGDLAGTVVYSMEHRLEPPHQVRAGETLATIAQQYSVPWELLAKINGVASFDALTPGQTLKVVRGPFSAEVRLDRGEVCLLLEGRYAGRFPLRVAGAQPAEGTWRVDQKRLDPPAAPSYTGAAQQPQRKLVLGGPRGESVEVSSAALADPASRGHLSVATADITELYDILSVGSEVTVRR